MGQLLPIIFTDKVSGQPYRSSDKTKKLLLPTAGGLIAILDELPLATGTNEGGKNTVYAYEGDPKVVETFIVVVAPEHTAAPGVAVS